MVIFGPLIAAEIGPVVWSTPANFNGFRVSRLRSVTARHSSSGRQANFAALNRGCRLYSAGRPSRWALAHILVLRSFGTDVSRELTYRHVARINDCAASAVSNIGSHTRRFGL